MELILPNKVQNTIWLGQNFKVDILNLFDELKNRNNILVVQGVKSFRDSEEGRIFYEILEKLNCTFETKSIGVNPTQADILSGIPKDRFGLIVAIGGGSVIDSAKLIKHYLQPNAEIFAIYTLLGSGSIVSAFTIFDNEEFKIGEMHSETIPNVVYINETILKRVPMELLWGGIADIASHALESFLSKSATIQSKSESKSSLNKLLAYLNSENDDIIPIIEADIQAGIAEQTGIVLLPHAVGHYLTYKFKVPHGKANLYIMERYLKFISNKQVPIPAEYIMLMAKLSVLNNIKDLPHYINSDNFDEMLDLIGKYMSFVFENSPVQLSVNDLREIISFEHAT